MSTTNSLTTNSLDLYSLLPAIYRIRDAERGYPLRAFLGLISNQAQLVKANVDGLWDDIFIETCANWVVPYIGDLVGNNPIPERLLPKDIESIHTGALGLPIIMHDIVTRF